MRHLRTPPTVPHPSSLTPCALSLPCGELRSAFVYADLYERLLILVLFERGLIEGSTVFLTGPI